MPRTGGQERRVTLVEEAIRQFGREGYKGASLDSIATAVGVRKQTLLYYFPTKDALLEECLRAAGQRLAATVAAALEGKDTYWDKGEAVINAAVLPLTGSYILYLSLARDVQSIAFLKPPGTEPLYSGEAIRKPSCSCITSCSRRALASNAPFSCVSASYTGIGKS